MTCSFTEAYKPLEKHDQWKNTQEHKNFFKKEHKNLKTLFESCFHPAFCSFLFPVACFLLLIEWV